MANQGSTIVHAATNPTIDDMNTTTIHTVETPPPSVKGSSSNASSPIAVADTSSSVVNSAPAATLSLSENIPNDNSEVNGVASSGPAASNTNATAPGKKRKRKKKKSNGILSAKTPASSLDGLENDQLFATEQKIGAGDDVASWKLRAGARLARLRELHAEIEKLRRDLIDACNRASDAEKAELLVNRGLKNAHHLLSARDKRIASQDMENTSMKADAESAKAEKKKLEQRIVLLKSVADKLQASKDDAEKKVDDTNTHTRKVIADLETKFNAQKIALEKEKEVALRTIQQAAKQENEVICRREKNIANINATVAGVAGVVVGIILRGMGRRGNDSE